MDSYVTQDQLMQSLRELVGDLQPLPQHYNVTVDFNVPPEPLWLIGIALLMVFCAILYTRKRRRVRHGR